ncbi:hypothetical protein U472_10245 [Orenia metallireducens]|uniref:Type II secretory pathway, pseudopilin PulG n=1 Tax=Orenia metallireducens TaxID=1413210 RepID=A0A1C0A7Z0_9FIRM|nr:hypothetical protein [Orenia metallireducens]OCL26375.1 hypothetical protein U472_10245 [Orenia metallireducens]
MLKQEDGAITIFVLSIFLALIILVGGVIELITSQFILLEKEEDSLQALYLAESGLEQAIVKVEAGEFNGFTTEEITVDEEYSGTYQVIITIKDGECQVISTGRFKGKQHVLKITID